MRHEDAVRQAWYYYCDRTLMAPTREEWLAAEARRDTLTRVLLLEQYRTNRTLDYTGFTEFVQETPWMRGWVEAYPE